MEYYFEPDDRLERKKYAEFLETLLLNCDKYRREDSDGAYVIALDSPWGTGKTRFVKMLRNYLEGRESKDKDDSPAKDGAAFSAVYYNSWETDFSNDALEPLIYTILQAPELDENRFDDAGKKILESFKNATKAVLKCAGFAVAHHFLGEQATEVLKAGVEGLCKPFEDPLEEYEKRLRLISDFKKTLEAVISATKQKKLVIIIDELDRCRPTFAIQTLELAKHLFAVPGLIFIFSLDIKQLGYSVGTVYSTEMDSIGYLRRFFDYFMRMPAGDKKIFITDLVGKISIDGFITKRTSNMRRKPREELIDFIFEIIQKASLSLRDITTIFESLRLMLDAFLNRYGALDVVKLYFCLLLIKYKYLDLFQELFSGKKTTVNFGAYINNELGFTLNQDIQEKLRIIYDSDIIALLPLFVADLDGNKLNGGIYIHSVVDGEKGSVIIKWKIQEPGGTRVHAVSYHDSISLSDILYIPDIRKWDQIKDLTLAQYYHRQLEMFDFVLPADEAKA